ncbi:TPA: deaminase [bacterium]|nr:deaminase [bacterium]
MKEAIFSKNGTAVKGPYSPAIAYNNLIFVSGQGPFDPTTGDVVRGDIKEETKLALENIKAILEAGGSSMDNALKTTVFLANMDDFEKMNEVYREYFKEPMPSRTTIQAGRLPLDIKIEIDVIAYK